MRAVQIHAYGDVDQLKLEEVPDPTPGAGEVLVRTEATSVNPIDFKIRSGAAKAHFPQTFPVILGRDLAGTVVALGAGVTRFALGARVMGLVWKTYATLVVAKAADLCAIPAGLTGTQAGALPLVVTTGAQLIEEAGQVAKDQTVLVTGALGGVGRAAVFVARARGARVLAGVRRAQLEAARALGAAQVIALDDPASLGSLPTLDVLADTVGGATALELLAKIKPGGTLASVVGAPDAAKGRDLRVEAFMAHPDADRLAKLAEAVAGGHLELPVGRVLHFQEVQAAHRLAERGGSGKIVLTP